jgi:hypothetical protein
VFLFFFLRPIFGVRRICFIGNYFSGIRNFVKSTLRTSHIYMDISEFFFSSIPSNIGFSCRQRN